MAKPPTRALPEAGLGRPTAWALLVALPLTASGCRNDPPEVRVSIASPPVLSALVFHGNCLVGWQLHTTIRVTADREEPLTLRTLSFRFTEGAEDAGASFDAGTLGEAFGEDARTIPAGRARDYPVRVRWPSDAASRVTLSVELSVIAGDTPLLERVSFPDLPVERIPPEPGAGGACSAGGPPS